MLPPGSNELFNVALRTNCLPTRGSVNVGYDVGDRRGRNKWAKLNGEIIFKHRK